MIAPGTLLQNCYLIQEQTGQGGMGAVYIATDQRSGSTVALKETFFDDAAMRRAFEREANEEQRKAMILRQIMRQQRRRQP